MAHPDPHGPEDSPPNEKQLERIAALTPEQVRAIDAALLANATPQWRKVARVVAMTMGGPSRVPGIPDVYYAQRIAHLVGLGALEAEGSLSRMGRSQVRLPVRSTR